jgi:hypothetical protein
MNRPGTTRSSVLFKNSNIFMYLMGLFDHQSSVALYFVRLWPELPAGLCWGAQTHSDVRSVYHQLGRLVSDLYASSRISWLIRYLPGAMFATRQISYIVYVCIHVTVLPNSCYICIHSFDLVFQISGPIWNRNFCNILNFFIISK